MPYQVNKDTYIWSIFLWESPGPPAEYRHRVMQVFYSRWLPSLYTPSIQGIASLEFKKIKHLWFFFFGPVLTLPLVMFPQVMGDQRMRLLRICCWVLFAGIALEGFGFNPHYAAPLTGALIALVVQCIRHLRHCCWRGRQAGLSLSRTDRKSTRLNSSHDQISYAVFCLKKKNHKSSDTQR